MPRKDGTVDPLSPAAEEALRWLNDGHAVVQVYHVKDDGDCSCWSGSFTRKDGGPCEVPGKHPVGGTVKGRIDREVMLRGKARLEPNANWGLLCDLVVVVDIDTGFDRHDKIKVGDIKFREWIENSDNGVGDDRTWLETRTHKTGGGGIQMLFALPDDAALGEKFQATLTKHVDIKAGPSQQVVLPGSRTRGEYRVLKDGPLLPAPTWLLDAARKRVRKARAGGGAGGGRFHRYTVAQAHAEIDPKSDPTIRRFTNAHNGDVDNAITVAAARLWHFMGPGLLFEGVQDVLGHLAACAPEEMESGHLEQWFDKHPTYAEDGLSDGDNWKAEIVEAQNDDDGLDYDGNSLTDAGNSRRLIRAHGDKLLYARGPGWYLWNGVCWEPDDKEQVARYARRTASAIYGEVAGEVAKLEGMDKTEREEQEKRVEEISRWARASLQARGIREMIALAKSESEVRVSSIELDAKPLLFNTLSGTLDMATNTLRPPSPRDLLTRTSPTELVDHLEPGAPWMKFLEQVQPDPEVRAWLQRLLGYALLGEVREHVMPVFIGAGGNGKGTFRDAVMHAFGGYAVEVDPALLMVTKHQRHGTFKMRLKGARLVFTSETEEGAKFNEAEMKKLTGGDPIEANYMRENAVEFAPSHTLVLMTNKPPQISGPDAALRRRIRIVPFDVDVMRGEDTRLREKLQADAGTVLRWAWEGWLAYCELGGLGDVPKSIQSHTDQYFADADVFGQFLAQECITGPGKEAPAKALYAAFREFAGEDEAGTQQMFGMRLGRRGFSKGKGRNGNYWKGVALTSNNTPRERNSSYTQSEF